MITKLQKNIAKTLLLLGLTGVALLPGCSATTRQAPPAPLPPGQVAFKTPQEAAQALEALAGSGDAKRAEQIFGPNTAQLIRSGDDVEDRRAGLEAKRLMQEKIAFEDGDDETTIVLIGNQALPFPVPLVRAPGGWRFDGEAGFEEVANRRIGRNELAALATMHAIVDAQKEYFEGHYAGRTPAYARRILSTEGKRDGLYWSTDESEPDSPLGPLVADAAAEGYGAGPQPYHGYYYRLLLAQGPRAPGGARNYLDAKGALTKGFGVIAWPAVHGNSGVMTFLTNQQGLVFQKDLGAETDAAAAAITTFDPDESWDPTGD